MRYSRLISLLTGLGVLGALVALSSPNEPTRADGELRQLSSTNVRYAEVDSQQEVRGKLLAFNDFHGALNPPVGTAGEVNGVPAGGVEYLATTLKQLRREAGDTPIVTVSAGDLVGGSPLVSGYFRDDPSIKALSELKLDYSSVGNHEFGRGVDQLHRWQNNADFRYLAANVVDKQTREPIFSPFAIKKIHNVPVGFVGIVTKLTPTTVNPAGISTVDFLDEAETANHYADLLVREHGVKALVLLIHEGGVQSPPPPAIPDPSGCANFTGAIKPIVSKLRPEYGVVLSGHTHRFYSCTLPNSSGALSVVTSARAQGTVLTDVDIALDGQSGAFARVSARNVAVENGIRNADSTWARDESGNFIRNPETVDKHLKKLVDPYRDRVAPIAERIVGTITADIAQSPNAHGESSLGDVVADSFLAGAHGQGAQLAFLNTNGIRAPLLHNNSTAGEPAGKVTYDECFSVLPFDFRLVVLTLTGQQFKEVFEQQFAGPSGAMSTQILQISNGLSFSYDPRLPEGQRIIEIKLGGAAIDPTASYTVATSELLANGGNGFTKLAGITARETLPLKDSEALAAYLGADDPVPPGPQNRITKLA